MRGPVGRPRGADMRPDETPLLNVTALDWNEHDERARAEWELAQRLRKEKRERADLARVILGASLTEFLVQAAFLTAGWSSTYNWVCALGILVLSSLGDWIWVKKNARKPLDEWVVPEELEQTAGSMYGILWPGLDAPLSKWLSTRILVAVLAGVLLVPRATSLYLEASGITSHAGKSSCSSDRDAVNDDPNRMYNPNGVFPWGSAPEYQKFDPKLPHGFCHLGLRWASTKDGSEGLVGVCEDASLTTNCGPGLAGWASDRTGDYVDLAYGVRYPDIEINNGENQNRDVCPATDASKRLTPTSEKGRGRLICSHCVAMLREEKELSSEDDQELAACMQGKGHSFFCYFCPRGEEPTDWPYLLLMTILAWLICLLPVFFRIWVMTSLPNAPRRRPP